MAATETVREFLFRLSSLLNDLTPQFGRWTERELIDSLNDGQRAICKFLPTACTRIDSVRLKPGTLQSIDVILPEDIISGSNPAASAVSGQSIYQVVRNMGADGVTPGSAITIIPREVLDSQRPNWHTEYGTGVIQHIVFDPRAAKNFYAYPPVPSTRAWVEICYSANPVPIAQPSSPGQYGYSGADATPLSIDDKNIDDLLNYCFARAFQKQDQYASDPGRVNSAQSLFLNSINAQVTISTGTNPNLTTLPFAPTPIARAQ